MLTFLHIVVPLSLAMRQNSPALKDYTTYVTYCLAREAFEFQIKIICIFSIFPLFLYLSLEIIGFAYVQQEAVDLGYLCLNSRQFLIRNFQLVKKVVIKAEKKTIRSVFELLDGRWLSKRYRICYEGGRDSDQDLKDCLDILYGRLHFYSISIHSSQLFLFSKFRPMKVRINECADILSLFNLKLNGNQINQINSGVIRKFKKLSLSEIDSTLDILSKIASATESLTIDYDNLDQPGIIDYLAQMDCKQIIVKTRNLKNKQLRDFFQCQSKAVKFIEFYDSEINLSSLKQVEWAFKHFTCESLENQLSIRIDTDMNNADVLFEKLFQGSLAIQNLLLVVFQQNNNSVMDTYYIVNPFSLYFLHPQLHIYTCLLNLFFLINQVFNLKQVIIERKK